MPPQHGCVDPGSTNVLMFKFYFVTGIDRALRVAMTSTRSQKKSGASAQPAAILGLICIGVTYARNVRTAPGCSLPPHQDPSPITRYVAAQGRLEQELSNTDLLQCIRARTCISAVGF